MFGGGAKTEGPAEDLQYAHTRGMLMALGLTVRFPALEEPVCAAAAAPGLRGYQREEDPAASACRTLQQQLLQTTVHSTKFAFQSSSSHTT